MSLNGLQSCLAFVQSCILTNKLKLSPDKIEFLYIRNKQQWSKYLSSFHIELIGVTPNPVKSARNLGVIFDKKFPFHSHISAVCSSRVYHIRDLLRISHYLHLDSSKLLATALVSSHLDYCNSLLSRIVDTDLTKLQQVENQLTHVVTKSPPFIHSVLMFRSSHWLPVNIVQDQFVDLQNAL